MTFFPRPYQFAAIRDLYRSMHDARAVLLQLECGSGKTYVAKLLSDDAISRNRPFWFLAPRRDLVDQAAGKFVEYGAEPPEIIMAGRPNGTGRVRIASVQTLEAREISPESEAIIVVDEAHLAHADGVLAAHIERGGWAIGLTATPQRNNGQALGRLWQRIVSGPPASVLCRTDPPVLTDPDVITSIPPRETTLTTWCEERALTADPVEFWRLHVDGLRTLAFFSSVTAAREIAQRWGPRAAVLSADDSDATRTLTVQQLCARELDVICAVGLFREGTDLPWLECLIDCAPTDSLTTYIQRSARLWRAGSAQRKIHLDLARNVWRHGRPMADRAWPLGGTGTLLVPAPDIRCCGRCGYLMPAGALRCPRCGATPSPMDRPLETKQHEHERFTSAAEADREQRMFDEERDKKRRKVLRAIAFKRTGCWEGYSGAGKLASKYWDAWISSGRSDWWTYVKEIDGR